MSLTSQIKLKQIYQPELSGYIQSIIPAYFSGTGLNTNGNIFSLGSGIYSIGNINNPFSNIYSNTVTFASGSGIMFGNTFFNAFISGTNPIVQVGQYKVAINNNNSLSIIGPSGPSGLQGLTGPIGNSGVGITGYNNINNQLVLYFSNGTSGNPVNLPSGKTGVTGAYTTGYYQSGNFISPVFSNGSTGSSFFIPSGEQGPQGPVGNIFIDMQILTGFNIGDVSPYVVIPNINPFLTENPPINLVRGMNYGFGYSGLSTEIVSGYNTNYFIDDNGQTGFLKLIFFNNSAIPGRYVRGETAIIGGSGYNDFYNWLDSSVSNNQIYGSFLNSLSMNVSFNSNDNYYYGFQRYSFSTQSAIDDDVNDGEWGFYVLGQVNVNYFGPAGPSGQQGNPGVPGPQGDLGPPGTDGDQGVGITGVFSDGTNLQLLFSNNTASQLITLPLGGPAGSTGPAGAQGPSGNSGPMGATGPQGYADTYNAEFYPDDATISGFIGFYKQASGSSTWTQCTGTNRKFIPGDKIWFSAPSLVGKAYSPWQNLIFADNVYSSAKYYYASVVTFNDNNGEIQFVVNTTPSPIGLNGGFVEFFNYSLINVNLGGLGSSGAIGPQGIQGPMGNTGHSIFQNTTVNMPGNSITNINPGSFDSWNLGFSGDANTINFFSSGFATGQTVILKIRNTGSFSDDSFDNHSNPLLYWQLDSASGIQFPYGIPPSAPNPNTSSIYTFLRFPNQGVNPLIFCTYSLNYPI